MYDLPKALENERVILKKKIEMGLEADLVTTYLDRTTEEEVFKL
jgi:hypothetical protein